MAFEVVVEHLNHSGIVAEVCRKVGVAGWFNAQNPWYLLTSESSCTAEEAWQIVYTYARRWYIEISWRYGTSGLVLVSPRRWSWERRPKVLLSATLAHAFLLSLLIPASAPVQCWLLRFWCHRTGKRSRDIPTPLYRLRLALSRLGLASLYPLRASSPSCEHAR
jgi:hypothetical protein